VWFAGIVKRHRKLSLRQGELTSPARGPVFNEVAVHTIFDVLLNIFDENNTIYSRICNMDTVVQRPQQIVAKTDKHQVGAISSREREHNASGVYAVCASGFYVFFIGIVGGGV
jgi:hypothetical protein